MEIDTNYFVKSLKENGELGLEIIKNICAKLSRASYRSDHILFHTTGEKLMLYIIRYWEEYHTGGNECTVDVKNMYIADDIGVSTRTLYRALNEMKDQGLLNVVRGNIVVTSVQIQIIRRRCESLWKVVQLLAQESTGGTVYGFPSRNQHETNPKGRKGKDTGGSGGI